MRTTCRLLAAAAFVIPLAISGASISAADDVGQQKLVIKHIQGQVITHTIVKPLKD